jgi:hypothetical protein
MGFDGNVASRPPLGPGIKSILNPTDGAQNTGRYLLGVVCGRLRTGRLPKFSSARHPAPWVVNPEGRLERWCNCAPYFLSAGAPSYFPRPRCIGDPSSVRDRKITGRNITDCSIDTTCSSQLRHHQSSLSLASYKTEHLNTGLQIRPHLRAATLDSGSLAHKYQHYFEEASSIRLLQQEDCPPT